MKKTFLVMAITLLTSTAFADLAEYHRDVVCNSKEVLSQIGEAGSCHIAIKERTNENRKGICVGIYDDSVNCHVTFATKKGKSNVQLKCGPGKVQSAVFNKTLNSESAYYDVSALLKTSDGRKIIMNDVNKHLYYENPLLLLYLVENDQKEIQGEIILNMETRGVPLQNVECTYF